MAEPETPDPSHDASLAGAEEAAAREAAREAAAESAVGGPKVVKRATYGVVANSILCQRPWPPAVL